MVAKKRDGSDQRTHPVQNSSKKKRKKKSASDKNRLSCMITDEEDSKEGSDSLGDIDWEENIEVDTPCLDEFAPPTRNTPSFSPESKNSKGTNARAIAPVMVPVAADPTVSAAVAAVDMTGSVEQQFEEVDDDYFSPEDKVLVRDVVTNKWVSGCVKEVDGEGLEVLVDLDLPGRDFEWVSVEKDRIKPACSNSSSGNTDSLNQSHQASESVIGSISSVIAGSPSKLVPVALLKEPACHTTPSVAPPKKKKRRGLSFTFGQKKPVISPLAVSQPSRNRIKTPKGAGYEMSKTVNRRMPIWKTDKSAASSAAFKIMKKSKFKEGEKILAKWSDHRMQKFPAVIKKVSGPGQYDVLFYDGFEKTIAEENIFKCSVEEEEKYKHAKPSEADFLIEEENLNKAERRQKKRKTFDGYLSENDFKRKKKSTEGILSRRPMVPTVTTPRSRKRKLDVDTPPSPLHADPMKANEDAGSCAPLVENDPKETATAPVNKVQEKVGPMPQETPVTPLIVIDENLILEHYPLSITCHDGVLRKSVIAPDESLPSGWSKHLIPWVGASYSAFLYSPDGYAIHNQSEFDKYMLKSGQARKLPIKKPFISPDSVNAIDSSLPIIPKSEPNDADQSALVKVVTESSNEAKAELSDTPKSAPTISASITVKTEPSDTVDDEIKVKTSDSAETNIFKSSSESNQTDSKLADAIKSEFICMVNRAKSVGSFENDSLVKENPYKPIIDVAISSDGASSRSGKGELLPIPNNDVSSGTDAKNTVKEISHLNEVTEQKNELVNDDVTAESIKPDIVSELTAQTSRSQAASSKSFANPLSSRNEVSHLVNFDVPPSQIIQQLIAEQAMWPTRGRYRKWINKALDEKRKVAKKVRILPPSRSFPVKRVRTLLPKHRQQLQGMGKGIDPSKVWRCPKETCGKKFRKENLLQMHIKHYHAELNKGKKGPKVVDLAVARSVDSIYISQTAKATTSPRLSVHSETTAEERLMSSPRRSQMEENDINQPPMPIEERKQTIKTLLPRPPAKTPPTTMPTPGPSGSVGTPVKLDPQPSPSREPEPETHLESKVHIRDLPEENITNTQFKAGSLKRRPHYQHHHYVEKQPSSVPADSFIPEFHRGEPSPNPEVTEDGVVIERLKSEEIINCVCGIREEDGLMVQCEICLCWQHGACTSIERDSDVPDRYVCRTCRNPLRVRSTHNYHYARQFLTQAKLPRFSLRTCKEDVLKQREGWLAKSFELSSSLRQLQRIETSLSTKINIAQETDHPKLYLWSTSWNENKSEQVADSSDKIKTDNVNGRETTAVGSGPVGEAPIESEDCRLRLLDHIEDYQQQMDARLSRLQAHIASLESEDADLVNEESCSDHHPLVKQAVYMMLRDLTTLRTAITLS